MVTSCSHRGGILRRRLRQRTWLQPHALAARRHCEGALFPRRPCRRHNMILHSRLHLHSHRQVTVAVEASLEFCYLHWPLALHSKIQANVHHWVAELLLHRRNARVPRVGLVHGQKHLPAVARQLELRVALKGGRAQPAAGRLSSDPITSDTLDMTEGILREAVEAREVDNFATAEVGAEVTELHVEGPVLRDQQY